MYWESLGFPGYPLSAGVETLAQWIQWAQSGVMAGINGSSVYVDEQGYSHSEENENLIRYNLNQFWRAKDAVLSQARSEEEKRQIYRLDVYSHGILNALATGKLYSSSPGYWSYWKAFLVGGTPSRPSTVEQAAEARQSAIDAATASYEAGIPSLGDYFLRESEQVEQHVSDSNVFWSKEGVLNVAGVPWWAWIGGAVLGYVLLQKAMK